MALDRDSRRAPDGVRHSYPASAREVVAVRSVSSPVASNQISQHCRCSRIGGPSRKTSSNSMSVARIEPSQPSHGLPAPLPAQTWTGFVLGSRPRSIFSRTRIFDIAHYATRGGNQSPPHRGLDASCVNPIGQGGGDIEFSATRASGPPVLRPYIEFQGEEPAASAAKRRRRGYGSSRNPLRFGAADRIRTGDVQLGKLAFCH